MPRKFVPKNSIDPYHVTARGINRLLFELPIDQAWLICQDYLYLVSKCFNLRIHSFVLMPNHFHLLVSAPDANISEAMLYFMRESSRVMNFDAGRINQTYGNRHHKSLIDNYHYFMCAFKYVYRNPVRAKICARAEDYPYSTLSGLCGNSKLVVPLAEDTLLFTPNFNFRTVDWINSAPHPDREDEVRRALKRSRFRFGIDRKTGRPSELETNLL